MAGIFFSKITNIKNIKNFKCANFKYQKKEIYSDNSIFIGVASTDSKKRVASNKNFVVALDGYVIINDCTIDNADLLISQLELFSPTDLQNHISSGSFNILIYDIVKKIVLFINDRFNYNLQYIYFNKNELIIAPRVENILKSSKKWVINEKSIKDFLHFGHLTDNNTFFKKIKVIPAATQLTYYFKNNFINLKNYWSFTYKKTKSTPNITKLYKLLKKSIDRLPVDEKTIISLSGGLDSRLIHILSKCKKNITYGRPRSSEIKFVKKLPKKGHIIFNTKLFPLNDIFNNFITSVRASEGMNSLQGSSHNILVYKHLRQKGYTAFLSGFLGDAVLGGTYFCHIKPKLTPLTVFKDIFCGYSPPKISKTDAIKLSLNSMSWQNIKKITNLESYLKFTNNYEIPHTIEWIKFINRGRRSFGNALSAGRNFIDEIYPFWDYDLIDFCLNLNYAVRAWRQIYLALFKKKFPTYCTNSTSTGNLPLYYPPKMLRFAYYITGFFNILRKKLGIKDTYFDINNLFNYAPFKKLIYKKLLNGLLTKNDILNRMQVQKILSNYSQYKPLILHLLTLEIWLELYSQSINISTIKNIDLFKIRSY